MRGRRAGGTGGGARSRSTVGHSSAVAVIWRTLESLERLVKTGSCKVVFRGDSGNLSQKGASLPSRGPSIGASR
jgi:hypothetical protein